MTALKCVVNSETIFYVATASQYESGNRIRVMKSANDERGTIGVTLMPNAEVDPSPDIDVHIYTSNMIPILDQVENTAHELYGHGYFYDLKMQGKNVNPSHDYKPYSMEGPKIEGCNINDIDLYRIDFNLPLWKQIYKTTNQAKENYKLRQ